MTITLELNREEELVLEAQAKALGTDVETVIHRLIARIERPHEDFSLTEKQRAIIELMRRWRAEDATDDPEELARRDRESEDFKRNVNQWRSEEGRLPAFK